MAKIGGAKDGEADPLIGVDGGSHLGQSSICATCSHRSDGPPPDVDLACERRKVGDFVRSAIRNGQVTAVP
jgi:phosphoribosylformylglycinamidine (FGAM) synthase-like enzyme